MPEQNYSSPREVSKNNGRSKVVTHVFAHAERTMCTMLILGVCFESLWEYLADVNVDSSGTEILSIMPPIRIGVTM